MWLYDVPSKAKTDLPSLGNKCRLTGAIWLPDDEILVCPGRGSPTKFHMLTLEGAESSEVILPDGARYGAVGFLPEQRYVIFAGQSLARSDARRPYPVIACQLDTGVVSEITGNQYLGGSTVFTLN